MTVDELIAELKAKGHKWQVLYGDGLIRNEEYRCPIAVLWGRYRISVMDVDDGTAECDIMLASDNLGDPEIRTKLMTLVQPEGILIDNYPDGKIRTGTCLDGTTISLESTNPQEGT